MSKEKQKKERVIHARVSEALDDELREKAEALGISVSNLVRNVLSSTLGLVEGLVADSAGVARAAQGKAPRSEPAGAAGATPTAAVSGPGEVIGWQTMVLNKNAVCDHCNEILPKGSDAAIGLTDGPGSRPVICTNCLEELRNGESKPQSPDSD
jgi:hypothetical protein